MSTPGDRGPDGTSEDPFDRPPNESGHASDQPHPADQTAPIQPGAYPGSYPGAVPGGQGPASGAAYGQTPEQPGYWEQQAQAQTQAGQQQASYGQVPYQQQGYQQPGYQPAYPQPAYGGYGQPGFGYAMAPPHPSATTSLVLGLVGLIGGVVACGLPLLVSPFAIFVGRKTMREIDASNGQLGGRSNAKAGFVMGIIGTVLLALALVGIVLLVIGIAASSSSGYTEY